MYDMKEGGFISDEDALLDDPSKNWVAEPDKATGFCLSEEVLPDGSF